MKSFLFLTVVVATSVSLDRGQKTAGLGKIIGGSQVSISEVPFQLQLELDQWPICGASIIHNFYALTSASCIDGYDQRQLTLRAGSDRHGNGGHIYQVYKINIHQNYDDYYKDYDIAVLEVATPFRFDATTQPINLTTAEPISGSIAKVTGWGRTTEEGYESNQLLYVEIPVVSRANCTADYAGDITLRMFCAGIEGKDACQGDTGGPLVQSNVQIGVTSWSYGCARDGYPGVYVNLANVDIRNFINSFISV